MNHELIRRTKSVLRTIDIIHDHLNRVNSPLKRINAEADNRVNKYYFLTSLQPAVKHHCHRTHGTPSTADH